MEQKLFKVEVEKVISECCCGYQEGDKFVFDSYKTPDGFCGGAYIVLFPILTALYYGATFQMESNPHSKTELACPAKGAVLFKVTAL